MVVESHKNVPENLHNQFTLLGQKKFLPLFITQFMGAFNDNVLKNALIILITFKGAEISTVDPKLLVNLCAALFILPYFLFSATAGQLADKFEKSRLILFTKILELILMILVFFGFLYLNLGMLLTALFLMGAQSTLFGPLKYSILPQHLSNSEILGANGLIEAGTFLAILFGTILGGILVVYSNSGPLVVSFLCILLAILGLISAIYIPKAEPADKHLLINWNLFSQTYINLKLIKKSQLVYLSILGISWFWFYGAIILTQIPAYTKEVLFSNEQVITAILTCFSVGIGLGSILCEKISNHKVNPGLIAIGAFGLSLFTLDLFWASENFFNPYQQLFINDVYLNFQHFFAQKNSIRILIDIVLIGAFGGIYCVPLYTIMQTRSAPKFRSRVIATNNIINSMFMVVSAVFAIILIQFKFSVNQIFLTIAILNIFVALYIYKISPAYINNMFKKILFFIKA